MATRIERLREYHVLAEFAKSARSVPEAEKGPLRRDAAAADERLAAARAAWSSGSPAPAFVLACEAWKTACAAARAATRAGDERTLTDVMGALRIQPKRAKDFADADAACTALPAPLVTADVTAAHVDAFDRITEATESVLRALQPYASTDADVTRLRIGRMVRSSIIAIATLIFVGLVIDAQFRTKAAASASYDAAHEAPNVLDAHPDSEWLLPDNAGGWLDLSLSPARTVSRLEIINAHNIIHNDRGTKEFRIELYSKGALVKTVEASFPEFSPTPRWTTFEVGRNEKIERVRLVVTSWYFNGGGFGEVRVH